MDLKQPLKSLAGMDRKLEVSNLEEPKALRMNVAMPGG